MSETDQIVAMMENPALVLETIRKAYTPNEQLITDYLNSQTMLAEESRNPIPEVVFNDTKSTEVLNLADAGHIDDDHFLSLFHPDTIDRAKSAGFKDIVLEAGDLTNLTDLFDEYTNMSDRFSAGETEISVTLGDETIEFSEIEYKAHVFGVLRGLYSDGGYLDVEEGSRVARAMMETLEYASSQDIRIHAIGATAEKFNAYLLEHVRDYKAASALNPEDRNSGQNVIISEFGERDPISLFREYAEALKTDKALAFNETLKPLEKEFINKAFEIVIDERVGNATINRVTADSIKQILEDRQDQGYTNPRVLHMHGLQHFTQSDDIDNRLSEMGISTQTIGFSGALDSKSLVSNIFNDRGSNPEFPQNWYIAPLAQYGDCLLYTSDAADE